MQVFADTEGSYAQRRPSIEKSGSMSPPASPPWLEPRSKLVMGENGQMRIESRSLPVRSVCDAN